MFVNLRAGSITTFRLGLGMWVSVCSLAAADSPTPYTSPTEASYSGHETHSTYIEMPDGTQIAIDYFVPTGGPDDGPFPVIFQYTPYQRSTIHPETGEIRDWGSSRRGQLFLSHGYALAMADMRGTGASSGWLLDFMDELGQDGKEIVDWIAAQPWCDGNVGMMGGSYLGWSQTATAMHRPEALKCIMPAVVPLDGYTGEVYPGGIYLQGFLDLWSGFMKYSQQSYFQPDLGRWPTKPAVDEDGDGYFHDEIPLDTTGSGTFLDEEEIVYADGNPREDIFYHAIKEHLENYDYSEWAEEAFFIDAPSPLGITISDMSPNFHLPAIMDSGIPVYQIGGWFDGFARGTFELHATMAQTNDSRMIMFPGYHSTLGGPFYDYFGEDRAATSELSDGEHLRFFDRYLKGIENNLEEQPPIAIFVMNGEGWRFEHEWPLARAIEQPLFLSADGALGSTLPGPGSDDYLVDFTHSSTYGTNNGNRWVGIGGLTPNALPIRTDQAGQCLVYDSLPMEHDTEVTGHPIVHLWVSSTANDGDFFVYLEDVAPEGESVLVSEGMLRAGFADLHDNNTIIYNSDEPIEVLPKLPWHGYKEAHYRPDILADGAVAELVIDLLPTSWVFREGHRLRISIAGADYPTFRLHEQLSPSNDPDDENSIVPTVSIHRGEAYPSRIVLPVVPNE